MNIQENLWFFDINGTMCEAVENTEVLTGDTSTTTEQDNVEEQEATGTRSADRSQKIVLTKQGLISSHLKEHDQRW